MKLIDFLELSYIGTENIIIKGCGFNSALSFLWTNNKKFKDDMFNYYINGFLQNDSVTLKILIY